MQKYIDEYTNAYATSPDDDDDEDQEDDDDDEEEEEELGTSARESFYSFCKHIFAPPILNDSYSCRSRH